MNLDVCICTHNPPRRVFPLVLEALCQQTLSPEHFHVWIVDNHSTPPLTNEDLKPLERAGLNFTLLQEPRLGNVYAREAAIKATSSEWIVFVDDDNVLAQDYLATVVEIAEANPDFGCFGGKLLLADGIQVPAWIDPLLPYLAIKDCGEEVITNCADEWGNWEPPTAGAAVRRPVLDLYVNYLKTAKQSTRLGRKGSKGLLSAEDSLMMRGASKLQLQSSHQPRLILWHHINPDRFNFIYMTRLLFSYGRSSVILDRAFGKIVKPAGFRYFLRMLKTFPSSRQNICRLALRWGYFVESCAKPPSASEA